MRPFRKTRLHLPLSLSLSKAVSFLGLGAIFKVDNDAEKGEKEEERIGLGGKGVFSTFPSEVRGNLNDCKAELGEHHVLFWLRYNLGSQRGLSKTQQNKKWCSPNLAVQTSSSVRGEERSEGREG